MSLNKQTVTAAIITVLFSMGCDDESQSLEKVTFLIDEEISTDETTPREGDYDNIGDPCDGDEQCGDGYCVKIPPISIESGNYRACSYCQEDEDCEGDAVCGLEPWGLMRDCVMPGAKPLGERCAVDAECDEGLCHEAICSMCETDDDCAKGRTCERIRDNGPLLCSPSEGLQQENETCFRDADCETGHCVSVSPLPVDEYDWFNVQADDAVAFGECE